ncbi:unnamed protein product [Mytilus coruscus]|uniref:Reverse transcriptase domain-containing protein n=1 Tax=Mytilus coruscus TaxID=42192 RepID=A0A6J8DAD2_MYTCO|nr:unnamed protein product [Mytilus coruscus]
MNDAIKEAIKKKKLAFYDWKINGHPKESDSIYLKKKKLTTHILRKECRLEVDSGHIGNISCCAPTCADDVAIIANNPIELQMLVNIAVNFSKREGYTLQPTKSIILSVNTSSRSIEIEDNLLHMNNNPMPVVQHSSHIGIQKCQKNSAKLTVDENIKKAR